MTGPEIQKIIEENNSEIEKLLLVDTFVLNKEIHRLISLNEKYQKQCPHEDNGKGICKYCMAEMIGD